MSGIWPDRANCVTEQKPVRLRLKTLSLDKVESSEQRLKPFTTIF